MSKLLKAKVSEFIVNGSWSIPDLLLQKCPSISVELQQICIPLQYCKDQLIWYKSDSGHLKFKEAFNFLKSNGQIMSWTKHIWNKFIPPSKSFLLWRIHHNRMPTDENLWNNGCIIVSRCCLCGSTAETTEHLFFHCSFAKDLWVWFSDTIKYSVDCSSLQSVMSTCNLNWCPQVRDLINAGITNIIWALWHCRNKSRFDNKQIPIQTAKNLIIASVSLSGSLSKGNMAAASIRDFVILKSFKVTGHPVRAPKIIEVNWFPPSCYWVKCNTDGAAKGSPGPSACGGIFRDYWASNLGCFAANLGISNALYAELMGAILAIEIAYKKGWHSLWLECDSRLVISAFNSLDIVPWKLRNRWVNCMALTNKMCFVHSHIFREANNCADKIASHGITVQNFVWWDLIPSFIGDDFFHNWVGLPNYRFC